MDILVDVNDKKIGSGRRHPVADDRPRADRHKALLRRAVHRSGGVRSFTRRHVIQVRHVFLFEQLGNFGIGSNRNRLPGGKLDGGLIHPPALRRTLVRQQLPQGFGNEISQRRAAPDRRDLGALHQIIWQVERGSHRYSNMLLRS